LLYNTVYGEPCTLQLEADGTLSGRAGYSNEDVDTGRWWVEGGRWFRQWKNWAYGESMGLHTVIDGEQVRWFSAEGLLIDTAIIVRARGARR
jgi:GntR family transcriptional regulator/MocR family aminotransferase